jgi:negative regulator of sigma E activity
VTAQVLCSRLTGAAVGIVALAAGALAGEPRDWLVRMNEAVDGLNYTGTFVQLTGTDSRALQVVHRARGGERGERLLTLDGNIQEIIRGPTETRCIIPARKVVIVDRVRDRSLWSSLPDYRGGIDSLYRIADLGREHVSGRKAQRIQVAPADDYRFGYQLWLDVATAMPLKSMTLTPDGRVVELVHFTEIDFPEQIPDAQLAATLLGEGFTTHYPIRRPRRIQRVLPCGRWLPDRRGGGGTGRHRHVDRPLDAAAGNGRAIAGERQYQGRWRDAGPT